MAKTSMPSKSWSRRLAEPICVIKKKNKSTKYEKNTFNSTIGCQYANSKRTKLLREIS